MKKSSRKKQGARLGQHFLKGQWAARVLTNAINVQKDETILEIGPGKGALTQELLSTGAHVVAIEKDAALVAQLKEKCAENIRSEQLTITTDDVRNIEPAHLQLKQYVLAANIPYYITGEIIRQFLTTEAQPRAMALLVQKEVAERIVARDGKESILSLSVKAYGTPKIIAKVARGNFSPPPSVDSAILLITDISKKFFSHTSEGAFFKVVRAGFASKRKFLANNLTARFGKDAAQKALAVCGIASNARAEDVSLPKWERLAGQFTDLETATGTTSTKTTSTGTDRGRLEGWSRPTT